MLWVLMIMITGSLSLYAIEEEEMILSLKKLSGTCGDCSYATGLEFDPSIFVCISFSTPDTTWLSLSKELERLKGVFVLRGIPENSFRLFSYKVKQLKEKGVNVPIQIDPKKFTKYGIDRVPAFVVNEGEKYDKVFGNISIQTALQLITQRGETKIASKFVEKP